MLSVKKGHLTHSNPEQLTRVSGWEVSETAWASKCGSTVLATKGSGKTTKRLAKASLFILTAISTKVTG